MTVPAELPWAGSRVIAPGDEKTPWIYLVAGGPGELSRAVCDRCRLSEAHPAFMELGKWSAAMKRWMRVHRKCKAQ